MLIGYKRGQGSIILRVKLLNSSVATGAGLTGLTFSSTGLIISTIADNEASATAYTVAGSTIETITTLGTFAAPTATKCRFKEVDSTNHKGVYEIQIADARYAVSSAKSILVSVLGATNCAETDVVIPLRDLDPYDAVRGGMTALPNANAAAASGLPVLGANASAISFTAGMTISNASGDALALTSSGSNGSALNASGNGTGAGIKATAGATGNGIQAIGGATSGSAIKASGMAGNAIALELAGQGSAAALSATGGATGEGIKAIGGGTSGDAIKATTTSGHGLNLAPVGTNMHGILATGGNGGTSDGLKAVAGTGGVPIRGNITGNITGTIDTATNLTNAPTAGDLTAAMKTSVTTAATAATPTAAAVTGAVGSVTGNVGGNVVGSVASVVGAVGSVTGLTASNLDATISSRAAASVLGAAVGASISADIAAVKAVDDAVKAKTDNLPAAPASTTNITAAAGVRLSATGVDDLWAYLEANVLTAGSMGLKLKNTLPQRITKNTALAAFPFVMVDSADHVTGKTGLTVTATRSIDGGTFGACANSVVEVANGLYKVDLAAADLNGNTIALKFTSAGADARIVILITEPAAA